MGGGGGGSLSRKFSLGSHVVVSKYHIVIGLTIIPRVRVGYEMIDSQRGAQRRVGYNHLISNKREWNNCFIKNNQETLLDHADFALQEQPGDNLMVAFS